MCAHVVDAREQEALRGRAQRIAPSRRHEDLDGINVTREPGQTPHLDVHANHVDEHGTAVLGETSALDGVRERQLSLAVTESCP